MDAVHNVFSWYLDHTYVHWILLAYGVLILVEFAIGRPARPKPREMIYNCVYLVILLSLYIYLRPFFARTANSWADLLGGPYFDVTFKAQGALLPIIVAEFMYLFIYDFFYYWHHRLQHAVPAFWITHKIHHMDHNMGVTTSYKHHWTDEAARTATILFPMALLFRLEPVTIFIVHYVASWQGLLIHSNVTWDFGPFRYLITGPALHRVHHSPLPQHQHCNFAAVFSILDVVFGTYVAPPKHTTLATGIDTGEQITSMWWGWMYPFRDWYRMARKLPPAFQATPASVATPPG